MFCVSLVLELRKILEQNVFLAAAANESNVRLKNWGYKVSGESSGMPLLGELKLSKQNM